METLRSLSPTCMFTCTHDRDKKDRMPKHSLHSKSAALILSAFSVLTSSISFQQNPDKVKEYCHDNYKIKEGFQSCLLCGKQTNKKHFILFSVGSNGF